LGGGEEREAEAAEDHRNQEDEEAKGYRDQGGMKMAAEVAIEKLRTTKITMITQGNDELLLLQMASAMIQGLRDFLKPYGTSCGIQLEQETQLKLLKELECGSVCLGSIKEALHAHVGFSRGFYDNEHFLDVCVIFEKPINHLEVRRR
jgi:hypothetical protein